MYLDAAYLPCVVDEYAITEVEPWSVVRVELVLPLKLATISGHAVIPVTSTHSILHSQDE
jgi:hypothetical protein